MRILNLVKIGRGSENKCSRKTNLSTLILFKPSSHLNKIKFGDPLLDLIKEIGSNLNTFTSYKCISTHHKREI